MQTALKKMENASMIDPWGCCLDDDWTPFLTFNTIRVRTTESGCLVGRECHAPWPALAPQGRVEHTELYSHGLAAHI